MGNSSAAHMATASENVHNHKLKMEENRSYSMRMNENKSIKRVISYIEWHSIDKYGGDKSSF